MIRVRDDDSMRITWIMVRMRENLSDDDSEGECQVSLDGRRRRRTTNEEYVNGDGDEVDVEFTLDEEDDDCLDEG
ncbi:hypothetical protein NC652_030422 [Populus alba x Populus x berolinensis]|nr:hypothetical protein NC652_030422 [Populus alba x Populus x berolinensis]